MTDLAGALKVGGDYKKTNLKCGYGAHRGYFVGLSDVVKEQTTFACKACKGQCAINGAPCRACDGTGRKTSEKVALLYQLAQGAPPEEEWVTYVLSEPGKLQDGTPKSGSTLWSRMRVLSGGLTNPAEINAWYASLEKPIKIGVEVMALDNDASTATIVGGLRKLAPKGAAEPQPAPQPEIYDGPDDIFDDFSERR